jgi:hypothetical protein
MPVTVTVSIEDVICDEVLIYLNAGDPIPFTLTRKAYAYLDALKDA